MKLKSLYIPYCVPFFSLMGCEQANQALFECTTAECVEIAIAHGADVHTTNSIGMTPLMHAAFEGRMDVVNALIDAGVDVDAISDVHENTAFMYASLSNNIPILATLIAAGADASHANLTGYNALMWATHTDRPEAVTFLLDYSNINVNASTPRGDTAFTLACQKNHPEIIQALTKKGATINCPRNNH